MPQFDPATISPQLVWLLITFLVFYLLMTRWALPRIGSVLEEREERIADDLDQAEKFRRDADKVKGHFEDVLATARAKAAQVLHDARAEAQQKIDARLRKLDEELAARAQAAEERIVAEQRQAMAALEAVASDACQAILAKLVGDQIPRNAIEDAVKDELSVREAG
ncbi:MAG: F0F1 ATP synthase subunit B' [Alphaproteobacteria bacterium]|nr:MAG: F0F1 ATP synthase subunit B' [Alphaproteobacteria bacterium]